VNDELRVRVSRWSGAVAGVSALAYPFALHLLPGPRLLMSILAVLTAALLIRVLLSDASRRVRALTLAGVTLLVLVAFVLGAQRLLYLQPVLLNGALLIAFTASLWRGMPLIERIARVRRMPVGDHNLTYLRVLTAVWAGFFAVATVISLLTLDGNPVIRLWWNGGGIYAAILVLVGGERWYRGVYRRRLVREGLIPP